MRYEVHEAIWLAAAIMTLEVYEKNPQFTIDDISFKQSEIQKRAQFYTDKTVEHARVNQWNNADHPNHNYKYLREVNKKRRITYLGEMNGEKEHPKLDVYEMIPFEKDQGRSIAVKDLLKFLSREYKQIFVIRFEQIIEHLLVYANHPYTDPSKLDGEQRMKMLKIRQSGGTAAAELNKLAEHLADKYELTNKGKSKWLLGTNDKVRGYLWNQLKHKDKMDHPTSISLFADHRDSKQNIRFRVSIELDEKSASPEQFKRHSQIIREEFKQDEHLCYYVKFKNGNDSYRTDLSQQEIAEKVDNSEIEKVQLVYEIYSSELEAKQISNEQLLNMLESAFAYLKQYYDQIVEIGEVVQLEGDEQMHIEVSTPLFEKNLILYGPPGTGKTYNTALYAVAIIENKSLEQLKLEPYESIMASYKRYKESSQIQFTTFHQSYGYEEFIEGIRPVFNGETSSEIQYEVASGVFKAFCDHAQGLKVTANNEHFEHDVRLWKISIGGSGENYLKDKCFKDSEIRIGWAAEDIELAQSEGYSNESLYYFYEEMKKGDIVFSLGDQKHIDAIGVITSNPFKDADGDEHYPNTRKVQWVATGIKERVYELNGNKNLVQQTIYELHRISMQSVNEIIMKYAKGTSTKVEKNDKNHVFIIDEINRGNISKILGELITLIEPTKRLGANEAMTVTLPYSQEEFGVPDNVYIIGTMNTADRSIALMDTALRRRFQFVEMLPNIGLLGDIYVEDINIQQMVEVINKRIEVLYDREHTIGHAYFMSLKHDPSIANLARIFKNALIPLLQEYFYEDYSKIQLILGDNAKEDINKFILNKPIQLNTLFKANPDIDLPEYYYKIQPTAFYLTESYKAIYE
ncbi:AAA family ATPase [Sporosarcina sp. UB5]|uniref:AAA family ATPase n=1 Tax=Sporosarcina sp. UB5 TaxID=3047463 RepID=UPI003D7B9C16